MKKADILTASGDVVGMQYAAICYRKDRRGKIEVLLITSRDSGRWVTPKGWPIKGTTAAETAKQEAFEEAGVQGKVRDVCIGLYSYDKCFGPKRDLPIMVAVYPLKVTKLLSDYPEKGQRRRKWFSLKKAADKVDEPELAEILRQFDLKSISRKAAKD